MNAFKPQDIAHLNPQTLRSLAVEQSQLLSVSAQMIKKLEKQVELGEKNQKMLFTAEHLEKMRHLNLGRISERREDDSSPLFGTESESGDESSCEAKTSEKDKPKKAKPKPKHPGRKKQPEFDVQDVNHWYAQEDCLKYGLKPWEGQFEVSELITATPSRIIIQRHNRQKILLLER